MTSALAPTDAYRLDAAHSGGFGASDDAWLVAASHLRLASTASGNARRDNLYSAIGTAIDLLGDEAIDAWAAREWQRDLGYAEPLMVLAERIVEAGALNLAATMLDLLIAVADDLTPVQRGRVLVQRARVEWKLGRLDEAAERYAFVEALGKKATSGELAARAALGLAAIAQQRGNFPELRREAERAATLARTHDVRAVERLANLGLMVAAAMAQDFERSLAAGWRMHELSRGQADWEAESLSSLGNLLLESGQPDVARACFALVMERATSAHVLLPSLGGLARASALTRREATVEWAVREVWRARDSSAPRYAVASALLECADALRTTGRAQDAKRYRAAAAELAQRGGFHELVLKSEQLPAPAQPAAARVTGDAGRILQSLAGLEPGRLPEHLEFQAAPA
jgi:tetratricopeptide (TPR) repeat protein